MTDEEGRCRLCGYKPHMTVDGMVWHHPRCAYMEREHNYNRAIGIVALTVFAILLAILAGALILFGTQPV